MCLNKIVARTVMACVLLMLCGALVMSLGCATVNVTPAGVYSETQKAYINAWNSYHNVWLALPDTDPRKTQWVKDYHPKFLKAAELLQKYQVTPTADLQAMLQSAMDDLELILIQLSIKKGA